MKRVKNNSKVAMLAAMFAMVFTFNACSGDDGSNGTNGANGTDGSSCSMKKNSDGTAKITCGEETFDLSNSTSGSDGKSCDIKASSKAGEYDIFCGEDKVGTLFNGEQGIKGADGAPGTNGEDGKSCSLSSDSKGTLTITCGNGSEVILCGGDTFSPIEEMCDVRDGNLHDIVKIGAQTWMTENLKIGTKDKFTWAEATAAGLCPIGWRLPSAEDFEELIASPNNRDWGTSSLGDHWWSSTTNTEAEPLAHALRRMASLELINSTQKNTPVFVRCLKD